MQDCGPIERRGLKTATLATGLTVPGGGLCRHPGGLGRREGRPRAGPAVSLNEHDCACRAGIPAR